MSAKTTRGHMACLSLVSCLLVGCFHPPFNGFKPDLRPIGPSSVSPQMRESAIIKLLHRQEIEYIKYGDMRTLIIPTDRYFVFNTPHLNEICYPGLNKIILLLRTYPYNTIYVAAFGDNVGSREHKDTLTQARAETMLTFLWANNMTAKRLKAEGYGDQFDVGDNQLVHASAYNRRIEIQWTIKTRARAHATPASAAMAPSMMTK